MFENQRCLHKVSIGEAAGYLDTIFNWTEDRRTPWGISIRQLGNIDLGLDRRRPNALFMWNDEALDGGVIWEYQNNYRTTKVPKN